MLNSTPKYCCLETENITRGIWTIFYLEASSFQNIFDFNREHEYLSSWKHNYNLLVTNRSLICDNNRLFVCGHKVVFLRKCIHMTSCIWCRQSMELQVLCIWLQKKKILWRGCGCLTPQTLITKGIVALGDNHNSSVVQDESADCLASRLCDLTVVSAVQRVLRQLTVTTGRVLTTELKLLLSILSDHGRFIQEPVCQKR